MTIESNEIAFRAVHTYLTEQLELMAIKKNESNTKQLILIQFRRLCSISNRFGLCGPTLHLINNLLINVAYADGNGA